MIASRSRRAGLAFSLTCGFLLSLAPAAGAVVFTNNTPIMIPSTPGNATPYPSSIAVSGITDKTTDVKVTLTNFSHTFSGDAAVVLVPPRGTNILLMSAAGTTPATSMATLTLADGQPDLPQTGALTTGTFKPTARSLGGALFPAPGPWTKYCNPGPVATPAGDPRISCTLASALNGVDPNGTWSLYVVDRFNNDGGRIAGGWSLDITGGGTQRTLAVTNSQAGSGTLKGSGTVTGSGVDCGVDCFGVYANNNPVVLTASAAVGSTFGAWTGCTTVNLDNTCTMDMASDRSVTATFNPKPPQTLTVNKPGAADGTVSAQAQAVAFQEPQAGIACGVDCTEAYNQDTVVELTALPVGTSSRFVGWVGCDNPTANACTMSMTSDKVVTARFEPATVPPGPPPVLIPVPTPGAVNTIAAPAPPSTDFPGPPRLELGGAATQKLGSTIEVTAETDEPATLVADGTIAAPRTVAKLSAAQRKAKTFRLPAVRADAPARTRVVLKLAVPRKAVAAIKASLKRGRRATARVSVVATDPAGDRRTVLRTIRIKR